MNLRDVHAFARGLPAPYPTLGANGTFIYVPPGDPYGTGFGGAVPSDPSYWFPLIMGTFWNWGDPVSTVEGAYAPLGYYVTDFVVIPDPPEQYTTGGT